MHGNRKRFLSLLLCFPLVLSLTACRNEDTPSPTVTTGTPEPSATETTPAPTEDTTIPTETETTPPPVVYPDLVGIYIPAADGTRARKHITEFSAKRVKKTDIDCFEIFACRQDRVMGSSFAQMWENTWNSHGSHPNAKIGFHIEFQLSSGEKISKTILKPSDSKGFYDYLEIYLYDDVHQDGGWYTHLDDEDVTEETVITSIKLTCGSKISQVGDIYLTAFIYDSPECFDRSGNYIGTVSQTIVVSE